MIGLVAGYFTGRVVASRLYEVRASDPSILAAAAVSSSLDRDRRHGDPRARVGDEAVAGASLGLRRMEAGSSDPAIPTVLYTFNAIVCVPPSESEKCVAAPTCCLRNSGSCQSVPCTVGNASTR